MDHKEAVETMAAQRYILDELSPAERDAFEEHYFGCADCAADVRDGAQIADTIRNGKASRAALAPQRSRAGWLAAAAAVPLLTFLGYQNVMLRSALVAARSVHVIHSVSLLNAESRGGGEENVVDNASQPFGIYVDIPPRANATGYLLTIVDSNGRVYVTQAVTPEQARESVQLVVPGNLLAPGHYSVRVRTEPAGAPESVGSFVVR